MLTWILNTSLNNRLLVLIAALTLLLVGGISIGSMEIDVFPDLTAPTVTVITEAHGMEAEEVERLVTFQIETGLNGSPNVRRIRSSSQAGISKVWVEFEWGVDIYRARQIVSEKIPQISEQLPFGVGAPTMAPISSIMGEIMLVALNCELDSSDENFLSPMELRTVADWEIRPILKSVEGVANVVTVGGEFKQYQVIANPGKLDYYSVTLHELEQAVKACNKNATGGVVNRFGNQYVIKGTGRVHVLEDISEGIIKRIGNSPVTIGDVAEVRIGFKDKVGDGAKNAEPAVLLTVIKQPTANTLELTNIIEERLHELETNLPQGLRIDATIFRQADFIGASVKNLKETLLEGAGFVIIVLFIFLLNWRTTVISLLAIPLSMITSFLILKYFGYTINTMSLGGMAIAVGALVDDAIIDVENVYKRLRENSRKANKDTIIKVVFNASMEIRSSIIIATLIVIVAFLPLFFLSGIEGRLLKPLGIAFISSVLTSLLVAVTITPVLCTYLLKSQADKEMTKVEQKLRGFYTGILRRILNVPKLVLGTTLIAVLISIWVALGLGRSFLPAFNEGALVILCTGPPSMSLEESNEIGRVIENILLDMPEIDKVVRRTGRGELDEHGQGVNGSEMEVPFQLKERSKSEFLRELRNKLNTVSGVSVIIGMPMGHRIDHMISGTRANIAVKIFGDNLSQLFRLGEQAEVLMNSVNGIEDVTLEQQIEVPQIRLEPNRRLLAMNGISVEQFAEFVDVAFAGEKVSEVYEGKRKFDLTVRYPLDYRSSIEEIRMASLSLESGKTILLGDIAEVSSKSTAHTINKENTRRKIVVSANIGDRDLKGAVDEIRSELAKKLNLPDGYHIEYGGQFENEQKATQMLIMVSVLSILVILLLLFLEFNQLSLSLIVLFNLPLALLGGVFTIYFTTGIVSIASTIGFISLFGIATRNGILLVSNYESLQSKISGLNERILEGSAGRLSPILMTALTTMLALIPLVLKGSEPGNEIQAPMAVVILGGLLTSTFLNLLVIPCVYKLFVNRKGQSGL